MIGLRIGLISTTHQHELAMVYICWSGKESACYTGDTGSIPGSGRSPGGGHGNPLSILAWRIPRTEEPGRLQSTDSKESDKT